MGILGGRNSTRCLNNLQKRVFELSQTHRHTDKQTHRKTDMATLWLNQPSGADSVKNIF